MKVWIYKDGAQQGPFLPEELPGLGITPETKVWFAGLPKWYPAGTVPELAFLFEKTEESDLSDQSDQSEPCAAAPQRACPEPPPAPVVPAAPWQPAPAQQYAEMPKCPDSYLVWSLILLVLCCTPFALASLITGILTMSRFNAGRYEAARKLSEATAWLVMLGFAFGMLPNLFMSLLLL